jgi:hypothetical protein
MIPAPAEYLLRCDDLCPTMSTERWRRIESLIEEFQLQPILAVVPDNRDPELEVSPPDPAFWQRMRSSGRPLGPSSACTATVTCVKAAAAASSVSPHVGVRRRARLQHSASGSTRACESCADTDSTRKSG